MVYIKMTSFGDIESVHFYSLGALALWVWLAFDVSSMYCQCYKMLLESKQMKTWTSINRLMPLLIFVKPQL